MTPSQKREKTIKERVLAKVKQYPGTLTSNFQDAEKYLLRILEREGRTRSVKDRKGIRWYPKEE